MARLAFIGLMAAILVAGCSAASPTPVPSTAPTAAPTDTPAPTDAPTATPTTAPMPAPTATPSTAVAPPPPTAVKIAYKGSDPRNMGYDTEMRTTITWKEANPDDVTIKVFGVTACLPPKTSESGPCLVKGTPLPAKIRELIASAPASKGKVSWTWPNWENVGGAVMAHGGSTYESVVIAAFNKTGHSKFVIVATGEYCPSCTY